LRILEPNQNPRTVFHYAERESAAAVPHLPDQYSNWDWSRHYVELSENDSTIALVRVDHLVGYTRRPAAGVQRLYEWLYDHVWIPPPRLYKPQFDYWRGDAYSFGPILLVADDFPTKRGPLQRHTLILPRPRVSILPDQIVDTRAIERLLQWMLDKNFRPRVLSPEMDATSTD
jgi:hypothetical protein